MGGTPSGAAHMPPEEERCKLEAQCRAMRAKVHAARQRRLELPHLAVAEQKNATLQKLKGVEIAQQQSIRENLSVQCRKESASAWLDASRKWNATNDCFHIWHRGPFGTINGLRLGCRTTTTPASPTYPNNRKQIQNADEYDKVLSEDHSRQGSMIHPNNSNHGATAVRRREYDVTSMVLAGVTTGPPGFTPERSIGNMGRELRNGNNVAVTRSSGNWPEINAALGMAALLLCVLRDKPESGIRFQTHDIVPLGSCSKIALMPTKLQPQQQTVYYNLFSDDSFQFFGKRNFNLALNGLLKCLKDAMECILQRDRTIAIPHDISTTGNLAELTIGGLPISYSTDGGGERWTRALKYFLTDLKWLVAFSTKHVDR
eukprot:scaffold34157_cov52-Attheya_sp.AAC.6